MLVLAALELCAQMRCVGVLHAHGCRVLHACASLEAALASVLQAASSLKSFSLPLVGKPWAPNRPSGGNRRRSPRGGSAPA